MLDERSLAGTWEFRLDAEQGWRPIAVPGCWEEQGVAKGEPGPAWYRRRLAIPQEWAGRRLWLRFAAVSYHCQVLLDGQFLGEHTGCWDAFEVELTGALAAGAEAELLVRVEKPAGLSGGPSSPSLPGAFPLKETLAGFLPYVWGHMFGGLWQEVSLVATGDLVLRDQAVAGAADGRVRVSGLLSGSGQASATLALSLLDPAGLEVFRSPVAPEVDGRFGIDINIEQPLTWSPSNPALYTLVLTLPQGDQERRRFGLRTLTAEGARLLLNGAPLYPRMALSWGWYPEALSSNPGPERVRADLLRLQALGYNGVKLCLWFPPQYYFDLADELGMLLWVELPMWLPRPSELFRRQTPLEYERLVRQARWHPSVVLYSLGCELSGDVGAEILAPLYALVRSLAGDALVRDNSGSGEAYGGLLNEHAQYYDYHFYSEPHLLRQLIEYFTPRWRPRMPWVFGEFCDYDTLRDLPALTAGGDASGASFVPLEGHVAPGEPDPAVNDARRADGVLLAGAPGGALPQAVAWHGALVQPAGEPWWLSVDQALNPQGARWQYDLPEHAARLRALGLWERCDELRRLSHDQGLLHRKLTLELVRSFDEISGYVVSGEVDTPITSAGMWDDLGRLKFDPASFRTFNDDLVLLLGWDRRRAWVAGGDRAGYWDTWCYHPGDLIRPHLLASCFAPVEEPTVLRWSAAFEGEEPFASDRQEVALTPGRVSELALLELRAPPVDQPRRLLVRAQIQFGSRLARNEWVLWVLPRPAWASLKGVALLDPAARLPGLRGLAPGLLRSLDGARAAIATAWSSELEEFVRGGGAAVLLQGAGPAGPLPTLEVPFWREAIKFAAPHPAWGDFPHSGPGLPGVELYGGATDRALDYTTAPGPIRPLLRRLDARTLRLHDYVVELELGRGRLLVTTLRLEGGQGEQPAGIERNTGAAYLLWCWTRYLGARS